jgi:hypothetical protein
VTIDHRVRCDEVVELVSDYLEAALSLPEREALEQHVLICADCAEYLRQLRSTVEAAARMRDDDPPLPEESLLQLFRRRPG